MRVLPAARTLPRARQAVIRPTASAALDAEPGDVLAPHLFDWYFDGVDDYVVVPYSSSLVSSQFTVVAEMLPSPPFRSAYTNLIVGHVKFYDPKAGWYARFWESAPSAFDLGIFVNRGGSIAELAIRLSPVLSRHTFTYVFNSTHMVAYRNATMLAVRSVDGVYVPPPSDIPFTLGAYYDGVGYTAGYRGWLSFVTYHSRTLTDAEISVLHSSRVVSASGLRLFLDATFFDYAKFIDLSNNGNHGYPYGGVSRVPAENTWVWLVKGLRPQEREATVLVPPRTLAIVDGSRHENTSHANVLELRVRPGRVSVYFESLDSFGRVLPASRVVA